MAGFVLQILLLGGVGARSFGGGGFLRSFSRQDSYDPNSPRLEIDETLCGRLTSPEACGTKKDKCVWIGACVDLHGAEHRRVQDEEVHSHFNSNPHHGGYMGYQRSDSYPFGGSPASPLSSNSTSHGSPANPGSFGNNSWNNNSTSNGSPAYLGPGSSNHTSSGSSFSSPMVGGASGGSLSGGGGVGSSHHTSSSHRTWDGNLRAYAVHN